MWKFKSLLFLLLVWSGTAYAQSGLSYKFRITLKDKGTTYLNMEEPSTFLSERAIQRRLKQDIPIDESDLPVSEQYISQLKSLGCEIAATSKWLNTVTVHTEDSAIVNSIKELVFVDDAVCVWKSTGNTRSSKNSKPIRKTESPDDCYGVASQQIAIHNGDSLHRAGYRGTGMEIAVIDGGFSGIDENILLENIKIKGKKSFIHPADNSYEGEHGFKVLSCMATNLPYIFVGTAPDASYWLLQSENPASEYPVEEDYWVAAAEYADSVGVDMINTSLGYTRFDDAVMNYTHEDIDGKTAFITRGANMASKKGILLVTSAGNEGNKSWRFISAPADSEVTLTVGAIRPDSTLASFSSRGPTADLRIKPDVVAIGENTAVITASGYTATNSGTSFSSPVMCGLAACLWQAFPNFTNKELIEIIRQSANKYLSPDNNSGYGIPDMIKAMEIANDKEPTQINKESIDRKKKFKILSDTTGSLSIIKTSDDEDQCLLQIISLDGKIILSDKFNEKKKIYRIEPATGSVYLIKIRMGNYTEIQKVLF